MTEELLAPAQAQAVSAWATLPTVQWALLLALAALAGYACQRKLGLPKVLGYAVVGTLAGLFGFGAALWPLHGSALLLLELGVAAVLFECGARINVRWFLHNPMVLVQSVLEAALTYAAVFYGLQAVGVEARSAGPLGLIAMAASPVLLSRVVADTRAAGPVTDRALTLSTLSTLYALVLSAAKAHIFANPQQSLWHDITPVLQVLLTSAVVAAALFALLHLVLRWMSPLSQNTAIVLLALVAAASAGASGLGGSAPLAALLAGMALKYASPRPLPWAKALGSIATLLGMVMFVLVATVAAQAPWTEGITLAVLALIVLRLAAKSVGVGLGHLGSSTSWRQALWTACAMTPLSAVALLMTAPFALVEDGKTIVGIALPAILLMELIGAISATWALRRAGEARDTLGVRHDA